MLRLIEGLEGPRRSRHKRHSGLLHALPRPGLGPHHFHGGCGGANELDSRVDTGLRKLCVLREEAVTRMNCLSATPPGYIQDLGDVQVGFAGRCRAYVVGLISLAHMQRRPIHIGINRHRGNPEFAAGANHPYRNFSSIGDQDLFEHKRRCGGTGVLVRSAERSPRLWLAESRPLKRRF